MQPYKRQTFICSAIEQCRETVNCCAHKTAHIKDERCVPRECRYALSAGNIDCDAYDPENPRAPVPEVVETRTVEQVMKAKEQEETVTLSGNIAPSPAPIEEATQEQSIKEAVKEAAQRPVKKDQKKGGKKKVY